MKYALRCAGPALSGQRVRMAAGLEPQMKLLTDLLTTDYGLAALLVTVLSIAMAIGFRVFFIRKMRESAGESER